MLSVADATRRVIERVPRLASESVPLDAAVGRVLATNVIASRALPGFDNSAMDGYAVRAADVPGALPIAGEVAAGAVRSEPVPAKHCVRIFTGGALPADLDTVVMQEDATVSGGIVTFPAASLGDHVRRAGEDVAIGDEVMSAGTRIVPWHIGLLAALGCATVSVTRRPRVAIIATGDELVDVHATPGPGQLVASSTHALIALIAECGGEPVSLGIAPDDPSAITALIARALGTATDDDIDAITSQLSRALAFDVVITTGGVSVGDRDHVHAALAAAGVTRELYKVAMKPGKPFTFGTHARPLRPSSDVPVFGLPGNPVSTVVAFELFVRPALLAMQGATIIDRPRARVQLAETYRKQAGRAHYVRATITRETTRGDTLIAYTHPKQGSAMLSSLVGPNAIVEIPAGDTEVTAGALVDAILVHPV